MYAVIQSKTMGNPSESLFASILTADQWRAALEGIAEGQSTRKACERLGITRSVFWRTLDAPDAPKGEDGTAPWPGDAVARRDQYARATAASIRSMADDAADLADKAIEAESNVQVQGYRLAVDTRRWLLSKIAPRQYGDRLDVDVTGNVTLKVSDDDAAL